MASYFEELGAFDRPFSLLTTKIGNKEVALRVRNISAEEQDTIDAAEMREYSRLQMEANSRADGPSEHDRVLAVYKTRPIKDIAEQLLGTRAADLREYAMKIADIDMGQEELQMVDMDEEAKAAHIAELDKRLTSAQPEATKLVLAEIIASDTPENLCVRLADININFKTQLGARSKIDSEFLFYTLYRPEIEGQAPERAFSSVTEVRTWSPETVKRVASQVRDALQKQGADPLPSLEDPDSAKPSSLADPSKAESVSTTSTTETPDA